jgi:hypothetical protein
MLPLQRHDVHRMRSLGGLGFVAALLGGCGGAATPADTPRGAPANQSPSGDTIESPASAENFASLRAAGRLTYAAAAAESVRAYLRTFKLNEKDLSPGLSIPFGYYPSTTRENMDTNAGGSAKATGRSGPKGHQIYEVFSTNCWAHGVHPCYGERTFIEIAPEPEAAPAVPTASPSPTPPPPAPTPR